MKSRYNSLLLGIILMGLVAALWLNWQRHIIEQRNSTVEISMEYENLRRLAALEGLPEETVLQKFKAEGVNSLMIFDTNIERLTKNGEIYSVTGQELIHQLSVGASGGVFAALPKEQLEKNALYVAPGEDFETFNNVVKDMRLRVGDERVSIVSENPLLLKVKGSPVLVPEDRYDEPLGLLQMPLGMSARDLRTVAANGFKIIIRPQNYVQVREEQIDSIFARLDQAGVKAHAYMPCGKEIVSYPDKIGYMGKKLKERNMSLVMLEHYTQLQFAKIEGLVPLAEAVDYRAARSYVIDGLEQKKISVGEALRRWALTDEERNIRVNYVRPFLMPVEGQSLMTVNLNYVKEIRKTVAARGYSFGEADVFSSSSKAYAPYLPNRIFFMPVIAAIMAGVVLFISLLLNLNNIQELSLWGVLTVAGLALVLLGRGLLTRQLLALGAASIFPVLSMSFIFNIWDDIKGNRTGLLTIIFHGLWQLALAVGLSLVGAAFLSAILSDSRFLLEIDIYRGVKLTFVLPVLLTGMLYIKKYDLLQTMGKGFHALCQRVDQVLSQGISFKHVAVMFVLLFIAYYFVGRSGHTGGVPVPAIELKMRAFLEQVMYARPREKEFMIGHPLFFLAVMAAYKQASHWCRFALVCGGVIGQGSLVQTFCHMRTPVVMSFVRALDGYAVGIIFGIVAVAGTALLLYLWNEYKRRSCINE